MVEKIRRCDRSMMALKAMKKHKQRQLSIKKPFHAFANLMRKIAFLQSERSFYTSTPQEPFSHWLINYPMLSVNVFRPKFPRLHENITIREFLRSSSKTSCCIDACIEALSTPSLAYWHNMHVATPCYFEVQHSTEGW